MLWPIHFSLLSAKCLPLLFWRQIVINCTKNVQEYMWFMITCTPRGQYSCPAGTAETNHRAWRETFHHSLIESGVGSMNEHATVVCDLRDKRTSWFKEFHKMEPEVCVAYIQDVTIWPVLLLPCVPTDISNLVVRNESGADLGFEIVNLTLRTKTI